MKYDTKEIIGHAKNMRRLMLDMGKHAGSHAAHLGGALSLTEVMAVLYFGVMNTRNIGVGSSQRDRLILSKGHGSLALYAALIEAGIMDAKLKDTFEDDYSVLLGHPVQNRSVGIEFSNGSLGMGLSIGIGVAIACRRKGIENHVYVVMGDGECNEGAVWEAFMAAAQYKLNNLTAIIDVNKFQLSGATQDIIIMDNLSARIKSFGWEAVDVDGHNVKNLCDVLSTKLKRNNPLAIVMDTVKGKGLSFAENNNSWHHAIITEKIYEQGIKELGVDYCNGI